MTVTYQKRCAKCGAEKVLEDFAKQRSRPDGRRSSCRECYNAAAMVRYYENPEAARWKIIRWRYGIDKNDYEALLAEQDGRCAICRSSESANRHGTTHDRYALHIDHDHNTGKIRGLLCFKCNNGIGLIPDPDVLRAAADYLQRSKRI